MSKPDQYDQYLSAEGPAALVIRQHLIPVEGADGVLFPPTFAAGDGFPGGYNIDGDVRDRHVSHVDVVARSRIRVESEGDTSGKNVCLVDSVGSQANRIEPLFREDKYKALVPQITVEAGDKTVSILEAGHRAGDALVRCSELQEDLQNAFKALLSGNAEPLAKLAPTSLVFGVWDSRDTQAKVPRVISSTIRAFDVRKLTRSAVYTPPLDYSKLDVFSEEDKAKAEGNSKNPLAQRGFVHNPASGSHGGVIADGGIRRDATLALAALRLLNVGNDKEKTLVLRRYILGLALVAFTYRPGGYLRQGCLLVLNADREDAHSCVEVSSEGKRTDCNITHEDALAFATKAAEAFGVGKDRPVSFDPVRAKTDVAEGKDKKPKKDKDPLPAK
ncbi:MAG TPA: type I-U CRISPR-associated RAMP protein Csb1/Cas7u [Chthoniobacteraceae bacterium]|jgi:CRISPR-associated protein Csb1